MPRSFSKYVHKAEKKAKAEKQQTLRPVIIKGGVIARTWWGKAWNRNLESCADYSNVIARGRRSVQSGAILDLQVSAGKIKALVQGSGNKSHAVTITIEKLNKNTWNLAISRCKGGLESVEELLAGKFPEAIEEIFMQPRTGLFPSPRDIEFKCSCPDWANMCKHTAATLCGIGARLDEEPTLFFTLRGVDATDLIRRAASSRGEKFLQNSSKKSCRLAEGVQGSGVFGRDRAKKAGSPPSAGAAAAEMSWEEGARLADVRRVLKKQMKMDARALPKKKPSP